MDEVCGYLGVLTTVSSYAHQLIFFGGERNFRKITLPLYRYIETFQENIPTPI